MPRSAPTGLALLALALLAGCAQTDATASLPSVEAAIAPNIADRPEGRARDICRNEAQANLLTVLAVRDLRPVSGSGGQVIGTDMILTVRQGPTVSDIRCSFTDASRRAVLSEV